MHIKHETRDDRFYRYVLIGNDDECWPWVGPKNKQGYGQFGHNKIKYWAHRLCYEMFYGPITKRNVNHTCDNPSCVNPRHLWQGSQGENMLDCVDKGRISQIMLDKIKTTREEREAKRIAQQQQKAEREIRLQQAFNGGLIRRNPEGHYCDNRGLLVYDVLIITQGNDSRPRDHLGRFTISGQQFKPRKRNAMGHFIKQEICKT